MQPLTIPLIQKTFPAFQLLGDSQLEHLAKVAVWFITAMKDPNAEPYWLSFVGKSGTGKTFLATEIFNKVKQIPHMLQHATLINPILKAFWPKLIKQLRNEEYWRVGNLCESNFAFIDEVAMEHDPSGFGRDKLCELLSCRCGKWTIITSNLNLQKLGQIDTRIASRMVRGKNVVCELTTMDYALRRNRE